MTAADLLDPPSHRRGHWFDPSIAHRVFAGQSRVSEIGKPGSRSFVNDLSTGPANSLRHGRVLLAIIAGLAHPSHRRGRGFESPHLHHGMGSFPRSEA